MLFARGERGMEAVIINVIPAGTTRRSSIVVRDVGLYERLLEDDELLVELKEPLSTRPKSSRASSCNCTRARWSTGLHSSRRSVMRAEIARHTCSLRPTRRAQPSSMTPPRARA